MDINKSIEELEKNYWKETIYSTNLVNRSYDIRKKKLKDLNGSGSEWQLSIKKELLDECLNFYKVP